MRPTSHQPPVPNIQLYPKLPLSLKQPTIIAKNSLIFPDKLGPTEQDAPHNYECWCLWWLLSELKDKAIPVKSLNHFYHHWDNKSGNANIPFYSLSLLHLPVPLRPFDQGYRHYLVEVYPTDNYSSALNIIIVDIIVTMTLKIPGRSYYNWQGRKHYRIRNRVDVGNGGGVGEGIVSAKEWVSAKE